MQHYSDYVKPVGNDSGIGKPFFNQSAIAWAKVNADESDFFPALKPGKVGFQILDAFPWENIKDPVITEIAESCGKALLFMEGMFVDAKDDRTLQGDAF